MIEQGPNGLGELLAITKQGFRIYNKQPFQAKTVKGSKQIIIAFKVYSGHMVYAHADRVLKVRLDKFCDAIDHGDLEPLNYSEIDQEKIALAHLGIMSIMHNQHMEATIEAVEENAIEEVSMGKFHE